MKQFKTLLIKELRTHKNNLLIPVWAMVVGYAMILAAITIGYFKFGSAVLQFDAPSSASSQEVAIVYWATNMLIAAMLGFSSFIGGLGMADNMLNDDYKKKCEIFHLSQPVSLMKILGSKLTVLFGVQIVILAALVLLNYLLMTAVISIYGLWQGQSVPAFLQPTFQSFFSHGNYLIGFWGSLQGILSWIVGYVSMIALIWFFNAIFRNKGFLYLIFTMLGLKAATLILRYFTGWDLYSPFDFYTNVMAENISIKIGKMSSQGTDINTMVSTVWYTIFSWRNAIRILISGVLIVGSYFIYREREVA